ncbi:MAG: protease complex subunit PrcB family protein [Archangiaceae bacterium]|nr:protease complex subunit PrcB family protein [Archangiaceae bacterium]
MRRLGLGLVVLLLGCRATVQVPFSGAVSLPSVDARSTQPHGDWLRNQNDLEQLGLPLTPPDWSRFDVVVVGLGQQGTTGHRVSMERITLVNNAIVFDVHHEVPVGPVGEALTFPGVVVQLAKGHEGRRRVVRVDGVVVPCSWGAFEAR